MDSKEVNGTEPQLTYWNPEFECNRDFPFKTEVEFDELLPVHILTSDSELVELEEVTGQNMPSMITSRHFGNQFLNEQSINNRNTSITGLSSNPHPMEEQNASSDVEVVELLSHQSSATGFSNTTGTTSNNQEQVIKAAKSLFNKRTLTLYNWMYPNQSRAKLKAVVSQSWDTLPLSEKHYYISQVLGRIELQASNLMVNPQLRGVKEWTDKYITNIDRNSSSSRSRKHDKIVGKPKSKIEKEKSCTGAIRSRGKYIKAINKKQNRKKQENDHDEVKIGAIRSRGKYRKSIHKKEKRKEEEIEEDEEEEDNGDDEDVRIGLRFDRQEAIALEKLKEIEERLNIHCFDDQEIKQEYEDIKMLTEDEEKELWGDLYEPQELFTDLDF